MAEPPIQPPYAADDDTLTPATYMRAPLMPASADERAAALMLLLERQIYDTPCRDAECMLTPALSATCMPPRERHLFDAMPRRDEYDAEGLMSDRAPMMPPAMMSCRRDITPFHEYYLRRDIAAEDAPP